MDEIGNGEWESKDYAFERRRHTRVRMRTRGGQPTLTFDSVVGRNDSAFGLVKFAFACGEGLGREAPEVVAAADLVLVDEVVVDQALDHVLHRLRNCTCIKYFV